MAYVHAVEPWIPNEDSRHGSVQFPVPELSGIKQCESTSIRCSRSTAVHRHFEERCRISWHCYVFWYCTCRGLACFSPTVAACGVPLMHHPPREPGLGCSPHVLSSPTLVSEASVSISLSTTALLALLRLNVPVFWFQNMHGTRLVQWSHG